MPQNSLFLNENMKSLTFLFLAHTTDICHSWCSFIPPTYFLNIKTETKICFQIVILQACSVDDYKTSKQINLTGNQVKWNNLM